MAYRTRNGKRVPVVKAATNGLQYLVALHGTKATFECQAGHRMTKDYGKGPIPKRMSKEALVRFAGYWSRPKGHCYGWCQRCQNLADTPPARRSRS